MELQKAIPANSPDDIDTILADVFLDAQRKTQEYRLGVVEATKLLAGETMSQVRERMIPFAEIYLSLLRKYYPEVKPSQVRIGLDYSSKEPTTLFIFPANAREHATSLQDHARAVEDAMWDLRKTDGMVWLLFTDQPDNASIDVNFPITRKLPA